MILQNKNIIVAGGSSGIGLATVKHLMNEGANVVAIGKNSEEDLPHASNQLQWVFGDLRKEDTIQQAI
ncbi:MAG: SDR family NAD(P)-dependent oxidoreductase, partial [Bacteroidota bacterium]